MNERFVQQTAEMGPRSSAARSIDRRSLSETQLVDIVVYPSRQSVQPSESEAQSKTQQEFFFFSSFLPVSSSCSVKYEKPVGDLKVLFVHRLWNIWGIVLIKCISVNIWVLNFNGLFCLGFCIGCLTGSRSRFRSMRKAREGDVSLTSHIEHLLHLLEQNKALLCA